MKKSLFLLVLCLLCSIGGFAQSAGDKIIGTYLAVGDGGKKSHIKFYKYQDGYRAQVCWIEHPKNPDGSLKLDTKNPDKARAKLPVSQAIIVDKVTYENGKWTNGKVYDPSTGKHWTVTIKFKDDNTLSVRGYLGVSLLGKTVYWPRVK